MDMFEMTVKDAVKILRANVMVACDTSDKIGYETPLNKIIEEALNVVIRAAEQSASDDCVSRQAALDAIIKELCIKDESYLLQSEKAIFNVVKNMPPVKPTQRWISVSERFPDPQEDGDSNFTDWVQVSIKINPYQSIVCSAYYCFSEKKWYMERFGCGEVIAWQPLPKPYEEKRGNENEVD